MSVDAALDAFALLADPQRLRVAAAAATGPTSTSEIATATGLTQRQVLAALTRLGAAAVVVRDRDGRWSLDQSHLQRLAREARPKPSPAADIAAAPADKARVQRFFHDGRLLSMPAQLSRRRVVLDHIAGGFEVGLRYDEKTLNDMLRAVNDDVATLRRYLVDEGFFSRDHGVYWRTGGTVDTG